MQAEEFGEEMLTVEIKVNNRLIEQIEAVQISPEIIFDHREISYDDEKSGLRLYLVNGVFKIQHKRQDGHRELARKMLEAIKGFKK